MKDRPPPRVFLRGAFIAPSLHQRHPAYRYAGHERRIHAGTVDDELIADIGAGTGISTALFLDAGYKVIAIEPNQEMREIGPRCR